MAPPLIDDDLLADRLRERIVNRDEKKILIARLTTSREAQDKYTIINCDGYGRIREFRDYKLYLEREIFPERPLRPNYRGYPPRELIQTQVFQISACNWRCWYCFVDDDRLSANRRVANFFSAESLIDLFLEEEFQPNILDLSGGQPDLAPEWTLWMVEECEKRNLLNKLYFWIDDNLSNEFLFRHLLPKDITKLAQTPNLSRMGCFKGFDEESFSFTTLAPPEKYHRQFNCAKRLIDAGFQFYAYATFMCENLVNIRHKMRNFVDNLQKVHELLPLRTTPLKIYPFSMTRTRLNASRSRALDNQKDVYLAWDEELGRRFSAEMRRLRPDQIV